MATTHVIAARTHGRFLVEPGPAERLLVGFHGYGENADESLAQMLRIPGVEQWTVVAVQALHRFYRGRTGTISASWMTSQDRERAIRDNIDYVRSVVAEFPTATALVFLGFSQGVAMAYRAASAHPNANAIVALAGDVPPDIEGPLPPVLIARGTTEEWYAEEKLKKDLSILESLTTVETYTFVGGHEWTDEFREVAGRFLRRHGSR
jgi:predicted esterase